MYLSVLCVVICICPAIRSVFFCALIFPRFVLLQTPIFDFQWNVMRFWSNKSKPKCKWKIIINKNLFVWFGHRAARNRNLLSVEGIWLAAAFLIHWMGHSMCRVYGANGWANLNGGNKRKKKLKARADKKNESKCDTNSGKILPMKWGMKENGWNFSNEDHVRSITKYETNNNNNNNKLYIKYERTTAEQRKHFLHPIINYCCAYCAKGWNMITCFDILCSIPPRWMYGRKKWKKNSRAVQQQSSNEQKR